MNSIYGKDLSVESYVRTGATSTGKRTKTTNQIAIAPPGTIFTPPGIITFALPKIGANTIMKTKNPFIKLVFNFVCTDNCYPVKNLARNLVDEMWIDSGSGTSARSTYIQGYDRFMTFKDFFLSSNVRLNRDREGIQSANLAKARQNQAATSLSLASQAVLTASTTPAYTVMSTTGIQPGETQMALTYSNEYSLPLDLGFLADNGHLYTDFYKQNFYVSIKLNLPEKVLFTDATSSTTPAFPTTSGYNYQLQNVVLEYEQFEDPILADREELRSVMFFNDITCIQPYKNFLINTATAQTSVSINTPKKRVIGVFGILENYTAPVTGVSQGSIGINSLKMDTESYPLNNMLSITNICYEGTSQRLYTPNGMLLKYMFEEAVRYFSAEDLKKNQLFSITNDNYYTTQFGFLIDLRSTEDNSLEGSGVKVDSDHPISFTINRNGSGTGQVRLTIWMISQGRQYFSNGVQTAIDL